MPSDAYSAWIQCDNVEDGLELALRQCFKKYGPKARWAEGDGDEQT